MGHCRNFNELVSRRVRFRAKLIRLRMLFWARLGRCRHEGSVGPAGGDVGYCVVCGAELAWDD